MRPRSGGDFCERNFARWENLLFWAFGKGESPMSWMSRRWFAGMLLAAFFCAAPFVVCAQQAAAPQEKSVKPGINDRWRSTDIKPLVETLETESREIYHEREALARLVDAKPGMAGADIGSGSGFMTELFAKMVGASGRVYAVDINQKLLEHIARRASLDGLKNIQTVLDNDTSTELPANSVDLIFLCDTYHHFEYPKAVLASMYKALRPGGRWCWWNSIACLENHRTGFWSTPAPGRKFLPKNLWTRASSSSPSTSRHFSRKTTSSASARRRRDASRASASAVRISNFQTASQPPRRLAC